MFREETRAIQVALKDLHYDPDPADGLSGSRTRSALEASIRLGGAEAPIAQARPAPGATAGIRQGTARYLVDEIVVHCTASSGRLPDQEAFASTRAYHMRPVSQGGRGWRDIGYHWFIGRAGMVIADRAETVIGAGVLGHNAGVIYVTLDGGLDSSASDDIRDHYTAAQEQSLVEVLRGIMARTPIRRISGHNEWAAKACPGFFVPTTLRSLGIVV